MPQATDFLLGKHLYSIDLWAFNLNDDGTVVWDTEAVSIHAYINAVRPSTRRETTDLRPIHQIEMNDVVTGKGNFLDLSVIQRSGSYNELSRINQYFTHLNVESVMGAEDLVGYYSIRDWDGGISDHGGNVSTMSLGPTYLGETPVTITGG